MNILIVTPFYKQDKNIASVRWTNIAKRLSTKHNIIVVTQPFDDMDMTYSKIEEDGILVARINQKTRYEKIAVKWFGGETGDDWQTKNEQTATVEKDSVVRRIKNFVLYNSMNIKAKEYAKRIVEDVVPDGQKIDVIISSACPFLEMLIGYELKKCLACKWISDLRDLPFTKDENDSTHRMKKIMKKVLKSADSIVTIAPKGKEFLESEIVTEPNKVHVITNGFSLHDGREISTVDDNVLHIVHTGSLYGGIRKADLFFEAIQMAKQLEKEFACVLECAGGNSDTIINTARKYGMEKVVINKGFVPREEALTMQSKADCLLILAVYRPGSLVAKLFEYILNRKPIICITCGEESNSDETLFVRNLNLGIAVEEAAGEKDVEYLANYLVSQWRCKINGMELQYSPVSEELEKFNHDNIANKIEELCSTVL